MSEQNTHLSPPNFLGGFLCGVLGFLAFAWLGNVAMWTAGTLGFAVGCWSKEILASVVSACKTCYDRAPNMLEFKRSPIIRWFRWVLGNRYRRLYTMRVITVLVCTAPWIISALMIVWVGITVEGDTHATMGHIGAVILGMVVFACCVVVPAAMLGPKKVSAEFSHKERWMHYMRSMRKRREDRGLLYCIGYDVYHTNKLALVTITSFLFTVCGFIAVAAVTAAVVLVVFVVRSMLLINSRAINIACLAVALAVTTCSAWALQPYLTGYTLGVIAVGVGCMAGTVVVAVRELIMRTLPSATKKMRSFAWQPILSWVKPLTDCYAVGVSVLQDMSQSSPERA